MPRGTEAWLAEYMARRGAQIGCEIAKPQFSDPANREIRDVHEPIIAFCNNQTPRWKYIHARPDQKSTIGLGVHDFTIFAPGGRVYCIECKAKGGKPSEDQRNWIHEMGLLGWEVHLVYSYGQFLALVIAGARPAELPPSPPGPDSTHH